MNPSPSSKSNLPKQMSAAVVARFGGIDAIEVATIPVPKPAPGEVLLQVYAAGVGPWDALVRSGKSGMAHRWAEAVAPQRLYLATCRAEGRAALIPFNDRPTLQVKLTNRIQDLAGGSTMDLGCYSLHFARSIAGEEPEVVSATFRPSTDPRLDEALTAEVRFPSGVTGG